MTDPIVIYCDGASSGNPGPSGWGAIIFFPDGRVLEMGGGSPRATNNQMELQAAISSLERVQGIKAPVLICTDSSYLINGATGWIHGWMKNGWKTKEGADVSNRDHWQKLHLMMRTVPKITWQHVRGHCGIPGNERADAIAVAFRDEKDIDLYQGSKDQYTHVTDVMPPPPSANPSPSKKKPPKTGYYLSLLGNTVERHQTWAQCEARVKGQSKAKFKKVANEVDEREVLAKWGVTS